MKPRFDGDTLVLPRWSFSGPCPRVPHRHRELAWFDDGYDLFQVRTNHIGNLFWVSARGYGFTGTRCSRTSLTCITRKPEVAQAWTAAVSAGKVRLE